MATQTLATINADRCLTHDAGHTVYMSWDRHEFTFTRMAFMCFVDVLQRGDRTLYAACGGYSSVAVDGGTHEVWIEGTCLALTEYEYHKLVNAALTTKTRLYGFRVETPSTPTQHIDFRLVGSVRPPKPIAHHCN